MYCYANDGKVLLFYLKNNLENDLKKTPKVLSFTGVTTEIKEH